MEDGEEDEWSTSPWAVDSLFNFQQFSCPECVFQVKAKQEFVDHACLFHPGSIKYFKYILDDSLIDVDCPWESSEEVKEDDNFQIVPFTDFKDDEKSEDDVKDEFFEDDHIDLNEESVQNPSEDSEENAKRDHESKYVCSACDFKGVALKQHWDECHKDLPYPMKCNLCDARFAGSKYLENHISYVHDNIKNNSRCVLCSWKGRSLKQHWEESHRNEPLPILCDKCDYRTYDRRGYAEHKKRNHSGQIFQCEHCKYSTGSRAMLNRHVKIIHVNNQFHCDKCGKVYKWQRQLDLHLMTKHEVEFEEEKSKQLQKKYKIKERPPEAKCLKCQSNKFANITEFDEHVKLCYGTSLLPYGKLKCDEENCEKVFNSSEVLTYHLYESHGRWDLGVCPICGRIIKGHFNLKNHLKNFHRTQNSFKCEECDKMFCSKDVMKKHVQNVHMKMKRLKCDICDFRTASSSYLKIHFVTKHTNESFKCKDCDFETRSVKRLQKHKKLEHPPS